MASLASTPRMRSRHSRPRSVLSPTALPGRIRNPSWPNMPSEERQEFLKRAADFDDGQPWGHVTEDGVWHELPKTPLIMAELGPPPFKVRLPSGEMREVV